MKSNLIKKPLPYLALLVAHLIWGLNFAVAKITLSEFPVMSLAFFRFAIACILMAPFLLFLSPRLQVVRTKHLPKIILSALFLVTFNIAFFYIGLNKTTAINASSLTLVIPIFSILLGWWFLKEHIYSVNLIGIVLGLFGSLVIIGVPLIVVGHISYSELLGNMFILLSTIVFVFGMIFAKDLLKTYSPVTLTSIYFLVGTITFLPLATIDYLQNPVWFQSVTILGLLGFLYICILSTVSAYFLLSWGLKSVKVSQVNLFQYLEPAAAASLAIPLLGERISFSFIIGTCLIILGVYWGTLGKPEHHHLHHKHHRS